ncbi:MULTISPECIES: carbon-nitrogen hydrolase family protein [Zhongshania]|jgi:predicted amidohydrolase/ribosomal protein S18 acetylase RimI-like enzyme|uniref:Carbon-nitrogen hydrolase n=4 Tax=Zhongshania TaxID=1434050 RepID=A0A127M6W2_9GAMM|nr:MULTISPECIES: carbon-nitrogen hydrolase family protein [Zhongshania]AMO68956.1 carbon-nitrogen hydrolase [Zhongshania aliphaticivorans]EIF43581.1 nitrilase/cyanide hydratase and apolipoprotein N- acyltransferase [gamma proteobacterium BDW918]MBB5186035.1 putative amidohydrolase/ribosomal protein S18 acetylase RimI-like enzyme [Zhongshania antarctica]|tara:strand:+ start:50329 stop:51915 length:1587 start_codon:yes stop_codon:yes gene_type:complete
MARNTTGGKKIASTGKVLRVRNAMIKDIPAIAALSKRVYDGTGIDPYTRAELRGQLNNFGEGKFVVTLEDDIVGYCATFRISGDVCLKPHSWAAITANGYGTRHDPEGEWMYGMEVCVDSSVRGYRIGQRLYNARKKLCESLGLKGIVFVGRLPSLSRRIKKYGSAENYLEAVVSQKTRDPVLSFQLHNDFEVLDLVPNYLNADKDSLGYGVHLVWHNPKVETAAAAAHTKRHGGRQPDTVRVGTVQYMQRRVQSFTEFMSFIEYFVDVVADYKGDFVVFPELITLQLLSIEDQELTPIQSIEALTKYTPRYVEAMQDLAVRYNINIIGGSHPTRVANGRVENISYVFHRDGRVDEQAKIHPTPNEVYWWNIEGGNELQVIDTDCGPIGVLICYDSEFPELSRHLVDQGAEILFVPFCTDERQSYLRVRYCCQARAVENQVYVVMSGNVGNLPNVANMDIQYAQSCILTPCDFHFARDGIAADTTPNVETVAIADLRPEALRVARNSGTVQNLRDRRHDLYQTKWRGN